MQSLGTTAAAQANIGPLFRMQHQPSPIPVGHLPQELAQILRWVMADINATFNVRHQWIISSRKPVPP
jgi:hypothetical protein